MTASCRAVPRADRKEPDHRNRRRDRLLDPVVLFATLAGVFTAAACGRIAEYVPTSSARPAAAPSASATKPTVVVVHGVWANESIRSGEVQRLQQAGHPVRAVTNPLNGLDSDAASVADFLVARRAHARITYVQGGPHLILVSHPQAVTQQILAAVNSTCARR